MNKTDSFKDIQSKNDADLASFITEQRQELRRLRFTPRPAAGDVRKAKLAIAQALTEQSNRITNNATA